MKKFLAPVALALALTASGAAFAAEVNENPHLSIYGETHVLTYDHTMKAANGNNWQTADRGAQYASRARTADQPMTDTQAQTTQDGASTFQLHLPE